MTGAYTLTGAGCKEVFNKGVLLVTRLGPYWGRRRGKAPRSGGDVTIWWGGVRTGTIKEGTTNTIVN